ncbi:fibronectin type III domain-containing protein [Allokutzneria oryzae]|uniref:Fibronectin type III domain-containing protein n=1 Tax=Allokutzneria oryzae TaxID=1378989 RepID=A0ABV5ZZL1_9PSEU
MERRRLAILLGAVVVLVGAVAVLRATGDGPDPVRQGSRGTEPRHLERFSTSGVILPNPSGPPAPVSVLSVESGPRQLLVRWGSSLADGVEPAGAAGYEVRWGKGRELEHTRLVSRSLVQLGGLENGAEYRVEVRSVDSFGQRSAAVGGTGRPEPYVLREPWSYVEEFDDARTIAENWRLSQRGSCGTALPGEGEDAGRLVITGNCGSEPAVLRPRTPFRLAQTPQANGELGRAVVETDGSGTAQQFTIDLVPGPVDLVLGNVKEVEGSTRPTAAQEDQSLPPGTVRLRATSFSHSGAAQLLVPPGTPRSSAVIDPRSVPAALPPMPISVRQRWEVVVYTDRVEVLRDKQPVAAANIVVGWREATMLLGFTGRGTGQTRSAVDLVGFLGAPTTTPPAVTPPRLNWSQGSPSASVERPAGARQLTEFSGGQLRLGLLSRGTVRLDKLTVRVGGLRLPVRMAVPGTEIIPGAGFPVVVDLPKEALAVVGEQNTLNVVVENDGPLEIVQAGIEVVPEPGARVAPPTPPPSRPVTRRNKPVVAEPRAELLDAAAKPLTPGKTLTRGRVVLEVELDGPVAQIVAGELAPLAGLEVLVDNERVARLPTTAQGPGVAGRWRFGLSTGELPFGPHTIEVRAIGVNPETPPAQAFVSFLLGPA